MSRGLALVLALAAQATVAAAPPGTSTPIPAGHVGEAPRRYGQTPGPGGAHVFWLPEGADALLLPIAAGLRIETRDEPRMAWLRAGSPWPLTQLPLVAAQYGAEQLVVWTGWPHYAELVIGERVGVAFRFPEGRLGASPCEVLAQRRPAGVIEAARAFRKWRSRARDRGGLPAPRPWDAKQAALPALERLRGAPHLYLWGPPRFSRHDVPREHWVAVARRLRDAPASGLLGRLRAALPSEARAALAELAAAKSPGEYLTLPLAAAIDAAMGERGWGRHPSSLALAEVISRSQRALAAALPGLTAPPERWGDGLSLPLLEALQEAGVERALLVLSDLHARAPRPALARRASELGFLLGPYDSYHSVHSPEAHPDETWETAQFDAAAYQTGRILRADGSGHPGFQGRGFHLAPAAAWPHFVRRVGSLLGQVPYSTWFVDCDATLEVFDDHHPEHPATRVQDAAQRRQRLAWLARTHGLVVGSEEGSAVFADLVHYGHGVHTPYLGHLHPAFRDRDDPAYLGGYWPSDTPPKYFRATPLPSGFSSPWFDPALRVPLVRAALGDELVASHHWDFDSLKFPEVAATRELLELRDLAAPMLHLNRETWPARGPELLRRLAIWSPLHRRLAGAALTHFEARGADRLLQEVRYLGPAGTTRLLLNFAPEPRGGLPPFSLRARGPGSPQGRVDSIPVGPGVRERPGGTW